MSARRNLNGTELNGRALRVDLTENDKQLALGNTPGAPKTNAGRRQQQQHPAMTGGLAGPNPSMARMTPREVHEAMLTLKRAVEANPNEMRELLLSQPMHVHAILQGQIMLGMVPPPPPPMQHASPAMPGQMGQQMPGQMNPHAQMNPQMGAHPQMNPQMQPPPHLAPQMAPPSQQAHMRPPPVHIPPGMAGGPPPGAMPQLRNDQATLLAQVMNMTPQQIALLPDEKRAQVMQLRSAVQSQQAGQGMPGQGRMQGHR